MLLDSLLLSPRAWMLFMRAFHPKSWWGSCRSLCLRRSSFISAVVKSFFLGSCSGVGTAAVFAFLSVCFPGGKVYMFLGLCSPPSFITRSGKKGMEAPNLGRNEPGQPTTLMTQIVLERIPFSRFLNHNGVVRIGGARPARYRTSNIV
jgi:hypothetical protein